MKKAIITLLLLQIAVGLKAQNTQVPRLKFIGKNLAGKTLKLKGPLGNPVYSSAVIATDNDTVVLDGIYTEEEQFYQFSVDIYTFYPVLNKDSVAEFFFDAAIFGKAPDSVVYHYSNSPSSTDWHKTMFGAVQWKRKRHQLAESLKNIDSWKYDVVKKQIDSLSRLVEEHYLNLLYKTGSVATINTALLLLKGENNGKPYDELLADLSKRFPASTKVKDKIAWFKEWKYLEEPKQNIPLPTGNTAPDFAFRTLDGYLHNLSDYRGRYVLLDFWASWCKPCREESPNLIAAFELLKDKNFIVLQISIDRPSDLDKWKNAIKTDRVENFIHANKSPDDGLLKDYNITSIPANYLINPTGKIIESNLRGPDVGARILKIISSFNK